MQKPILKNRIEQFLSDPGLQLKHPNKKGINLEDIFIFPDIELGNKKIINSKELLQINTNINKISISGIEDSGKTTLFKVLINHYLTSGYYPVYINAQHITITDPNELQEIINRSYENMYEHDSLEIINLGNNKKRAIFIDNFDKINCDTTILIKILNTLCSEFDNLIFSEESPFNILKDTELKRLYPELLEEINRYELIEFSNELKSKLIEKWHKLSETNVSDKESLLLTTEKTNKILDTVIGQNLVPSLPVFLLTILQSISEEETELVSGSTYSHYYEHLTIKSIVNSIGNQDIELYMEFLSKLAYYMFKEDKKSVSYEELKDIYENKLEHGVSIKSLELFIESLINADTLTEETFYYFRYRYIYHYFVARYLSKNIKLEPVNKLIIHIFREIYNEDNAHIALFLTYLSDDTLIIDELLRRTKSIFSKDAMFSTEKDSHEIDEIIAELSRLAAIDRKLREIPTKYMASNQNMSYNRLILETYRNRHNTQEIEGQYDIEGFKIANNILKVVNEVLRNRKNAHI